MRSSVLNLRRFCATLPNASPRHTMKALANRNMHLQDDVTAPGEAALIDPKALMSIRNLELRARVVVEGFWSGIHRSPYHGFSVEFTEYRQYTSGDDPRYLDWRVFA